MSNDFIFLADQFDIQEVENLLINFKKIKIIRSIFSIFDKIAYFSLIFVENESNMVK